jgi:HK97 family phage prohead protease
MSIELKTFDARSQRGRIRLHLRSQCIQSRWTPRAGTLKLSRHGGGLRLEVELPKNHDADTMADSIQRSDVSQCSFTFRQLDDDWWRDENGTLRASR